MVLEDIIINEVVVEEEIQLDHRVGVDGEDAFQLWLQIPGNENKTFQDWLDWLQAQSCLYEGNDYPDEGYKLWLNPLELDANNLPGTLRFKVNNTWKEVAGNGRGSSSLNFNFKEVVSQNNTFNVNYKQSEGSYYIHLGQENTPYYITINNLTEGEGGLLLIKQSGNKIIGFTNLKGVFDIPKFDGDLLLVSFFKKDGGIYGKGDQILSNGEMRVPQTISDLLIDYYDSNTAQIKWTAPHGNLETDRVTGYDIRYANSLVDADSLAIWNSMKVLTNNLYPKTIGELERLTITGLKSNQEYYLYIKSYQVVFGVKYYSLASNFTYFKTQSNASDSITPYRISLNNSQLHASVTKVIRGYGDTAATIKQMTDEIANTVFLPTGYPDLTNKNFNTYYQPYSYGRDTAYFKIIIDLYQAYYLDKLFIYSSSQGAYSIYRIPDFKADPILVSENTTKGNTWVTINFNNNPCRFILIQHDLQEFCSASTNPKIPLGSYGIPDPYYNWDIGRFNNIILYGKSVEGIPDGIKPSALRLTTQKTADEFLCTNGHFYQSGRMHSKVSGSNVRLYGHGGHFTSHPGVGNNPWGTIKDFKFRLNELSWVKNNGPGLFLKELLNDTYRPYGLKPIICFTGVFDSVQLVYNGKTYAESTAVDNHAFSELPKPIPKNAQRGLDEYLGITSDPNNYKIYSKLAYALGNLYGNDKTKPLEGCIFDNAGTDSGLNLLGGLEMDNEPDAGWLGFIGYRLPEEYISQQSAVYDGNNKQINGLVREEYFGIKNADANLISILPGLASNNSGYILWSILHSRNKRNSLSLPFDAFNFHMYFSNMWLDGNVSDSKMNHATSPEINFLESAATSEFLKNIELRNLYARDKEIWVTEFGYGESGGINTDSRYQCYSMMGRTINNVVIPDRHRSDIKGAWTVRAIFKFLELGIDKAHTYITFSDSNWFDDRDGGGGAGYEMFEWDKLTSNVPGEKLNAIRSYEVPYTRGGFSSFGFFGQALSNGGYPISRSYWQIALFRNALKGFIYVGKQEIVDFPKAEVHCFYNEAENKGAYAIYYNDSVNNAYLQMPVLVPESASRAALKSCVVPKIPDPRTVPSTLGTDQLRTGIPTSRKEKYINGEWVVINRKPDSVNFESYSLLPAVYPENPQEGDIVTVLPDSTENPYFPIVGPVASKRSPLSGELLGANQYEIQEKNLEGDLLWMAKYNTPALSWRQVDAICDYLDYEPGAVSAQQGVSSDLFPTDGIITIPVVDEIPKYLVFEGFPVLTFKGKVENLCANPINSTSIKLYWNNTDVNTTHFDIFISSLPESGYTLHSTITSGNNNCAIDNLSANTTYYFKMRAVRNGMTGELSDYISCKTYSQIANISDLSISEITSKSLKLNWSATLIDNFMGYAIFKNNGDGNYVLVATILDKSVSQFVDTPLSAGQPYSYKIRILSTNGTSEYSNVATERTLSIEESAPEILKAETDKIGSKIILTFNINLEEPNTDIIQKLLLKENGNTRLITSVSLDYTNPNRLFLYLYPGSIASYDGNTVLNLTYVNDNSEYLKSIYDIPVNAFEDLFVFNNIGNFVNLRATYLINLTNPDYTTDDPAWNNVIHEALIENKETIRVNDKYNRGEYLDIKVNYSTLPGIYVDGRCRFTDIPLNVKKTGFGIGIPTNKIYYEISPKNSNRRFKILGYASRFRSVDTQYAWSILEAGGILSNITDNKKEEAGNSFMYLDDITPVDGKIKMAIYNPYHGIRPEALWQGASLNFLIIEEYLANEDPDSDDIYIVNTSIGENKEVTEREQSLTYTCMGNPTEYRVSENVDFTDSEWQPIADTIPFTLSEGFGAKIVYLQFKNMAFSSNVKVLTLNYIDSYVPLLLNNIFINNNRGITYARDVQILMDYQGSATHYKIAETFLGLEAAEWVSYTGNNVSFTLSEGEGVKYVYVKIKDSRTESDAKLDEIDYQILTYTEHQIDIQLLSIPDNIRVNFASVKYNKSFALSITWDDNGVSTWNRAFNYFNNKLIDNLPSGEYYHKHLSRPVGSLSGKTLTYGIGNGVVRRFPVTNAGWYNLKNQYWSGPITNPINSTGIQFAYLIWNEQRDILDFGGSCALHDVQSPNVAGDGTGYSGGTISEVLEGIEDAQTNVIQPELGRRLQVMVEPNGDPVYTQAAERLDDIIMILRQHNPSLGYDYVNLKNPNLNLNKLKVGRILQDSATFEQWKNSILDSIINSSNADVAMYADLGMHGLYNNDGISPVTSENIENISKIKLFNWLYENYGSAGNDNCWFASAEEVIQYLRCKDAAKLNWSITNNVLSVTVAIPNLPNLRWKDLTVNVDIEPSLVLGVTNNTIPGLNHENMGNTLMINIDGSNELLAKAEKYVQLYESSQNSETKADAEYFIQLLNPALQQAFLARMLVFQQPPILNSMLLNGGDAITNTLDVNVSFDHSGSVPTHYMISTDSDFVGTEWIALVESIEFRLPDLEKSHIVYIKVKNEFGESNVVSDSIEYVYVNPNIFELSSIIINNGDVATSNPIISVVPTIVGIGVPTEYRIGVTADLTGETWHNYENQISYTLPISYQPYNVYVQLKNSYCESTVKSALIQLNAAVAVSAILVGDVEGTVPLGSVVYEQDFVTSKYVNKINSGTNTSYTAKNLKDTDNNALTWEIGFNTTDYTNDPDNPLVNNMLITSTDNKPTVTGDSGVIGDAYLNGRNPAPNSQNLKDGRKGMLKLKLPVGIYTINVLTSINTGSNLTEAQYDNCFYQFKVENILGNAIRVKPVGFNLVNNNQYNATTQITVSTEPTTRNVTFYFYNTMGYYYKPSWKVIEIIKIA